jgi:hypothetical protein
VKPWKECPNCHQEYKNDLRLDIANAFASFVRRQYPENTPLQVDALYLKLYHLMSEFEYIQLLVQKREASVTASVILSLIDRMKKVTPRLSTRYSRFEASACSALGYIAFEEGTEESARRAVVYFEKAQKLFGAIGDFDGVTNAKLNLARVKSLQHKGGSTDEELIQVFQDSYALRVTLCGEQHELSIHAGTNYAIALHQAHRAKEACDLFTKMLVISKQVLGHHHNLTKDIESAFESAIRQGSNDAIALHNDNRRGRGEAYARREEVLELLTKMLATSKQAFGHQHSLTEEIESTLKQVIGH